MVDTATTKNSSPQSLQRLYGLPMVRQTVDFTFVTYNRVKSFNSLFTGGFNLVEQVGGGLIQNLKPIAHKFDKQILQADAVVNYALDTVETRLPSVKTLSPQQLIADSLAKVQSARTTALATMQSVQQLGVQKLLNASQSPLAQAILRSVDAAIQHLDKAVDTYLPACPEEDSDDESDKITPQEEDKLHRTIFYTLAKLSALSTKIRKRLYKQAQDKFHYLQRLIL